MHFYAQGLLKCIRAFITFVVHSKILQHVLKGLGHVMQTNFF